MVYIVGHTIYTLIAVSQEDRLHTPHPNKNLAHILVGETAVVTWAPVNLPGERGVASASGHRRGDRHEVLLPQTVQELHAGKSCAESHQNI